MIDYKYYLWLQKIHKKNSYEEIRSAMLLIREQNKNATSTKEKWINLSKLTRNHYWQLKSILDNNSYNNVLNALASLERKN